MKQALDALEGWAGHGKWIYPESALEQAKKNTSAGLQWFCQHPPKRGDRLYTAPQPTAQREWRGLTKEERKNIWSADQMTQEEWDELFDTVETKLKEKNT
jgi:hypothetical protein